MFREILTQEGENSNVHQNYKKMSPTFTSGPADSSTLDFNNVDSLL